MDSRLNKNLNCKKYILFTVCFALIAVPLFFRSTNGDYAALGGWDAVTQMYPVMLYVSRLLKEMFASLLSGTFSLPLVEYTLGMGDDLISALNWHGFGDPLYLLSVFVSEANLPYFYTFMFYLKVFLGGIAFIAMAYEIDSDKSDRSYALGALIYCFSGFTIQSNMHIIFTHAIMYIPLLILGAERSFHHKKKWVLTVSVFGFALSGFFFLYIGSVTLGIYVIYRLWIARCKPVEYVKSISMVAIEYIIGLALSGFIFIPAVVGFLTSNRATVKTNLDLFMSLGEIKKIFVNIIFPNDSYQVLSMVPIGVICILTILFSKKYIRTKINIVVLLLISFIPAVNCAMSGFGEIYDRWQVIIVLYFAFLTTHLWDELDNLTIIQKVGIAIVYILFVAFGKKYDLLDSENYRTALIAYGIMLVVLCIILPLLKVVKKNNIGKFILFFISFLIVAQSWKIIYRDREASTVRERNVVKELINDDDGFYRIDNARTYSEPRTALNIAFIQGYNGISEYFSIENNSYTNALVEWNASSQASLNHNNTGMDNRAVLETLSAVKYFVRQTESSIPVPWGFTEQGKTDDGEWTLFKNENALPLFYAYDKVYNEDEYIGISGLKKQEIILQAAAVENYEGKIPVSANIDKKLMDVDYVITDMKNVSKASDTFIFEEKNSEGGSITLTATLQPDKENYILIKHLDIDNVFEINKSDEYLTGANITADYNNMYVCLNLGCVENETDVEYTVSVKNPDRFDMSLLSFDFSDFEERVDKLRVENEYIEVGTNKISTKVSLDKRKIVCLAMPYSKGWTATIDGTCSKVYRINDMFMGIEVDEGTHVIEFSYITPGLKVGVMVTVVAFLFLIVYFVFSCRSGIALKLHLLSKRR